MKSKNKLQKNKVKNVKTPIKKLDKKFLWVIIILAVVVVLSDLFIIIFTFLTPTLYKIIDIKVLLAITILFIMVTLYLMDAIFVIYLSPNPYESANKIWNESKYFLINIVTLIIGYYFGTKV